MKTFAKKTVVAGLLAGMGLFGVACQRGTGGAGQDDMNRGDTTGYGAPADDRPMPQEMEPGTGGAPQEDIGIHDDQGAGQDLQMQQDPTMQDPAMQDPAMQDDGMGGAGQGGMQQDYEGEQNPGGVNSRDLEMQDGGTGGSGFPAEENPENTDIITDDPNQDMNQNMDAQ